MRPRVPSRQARACFALSLLAALAACRAADDALTPARPEFPVDATGLRRLTYNPHADAGPLWTPDGAGVSYIAESLPRAVVPWLRSRVPAEGGTAVEELPAYRLQGAIEPLSLVRRVAADTAALGYLEYFLPCACLTALQPDVRAVAAVEVPLVGLQPALTSLRQVRLPLVGLYQVTQVTQGPLGSAYHINMYPAFHRRRDTHANPFGPSWAPDGTRLALSDGDRLYLWTLATGALDTVPGLSDAAFPRWSPDGRWIAFTHYPRDSAVVRSCSKQQGLGACYNDLHVFYSSTPEVWIVHPDGSAPTLVTAGEQPAWMPTSDALVVRRTTGLVVVDLAGAERTILAVGDANEPAVSPDGRRIVFVSRNAGSIDLWTVELALLR
jgi:hypothetical protein